MAWWSKLFIGRELSIREEKKKKAYKTIVVIMFTKKTHVDIKKLTLKIQDSKKDTASRLRHLKTISGNNTITIERKCPTSPTLVHGGNGRIRWTEIVIFLQVACVWSSYEFETFCSRFIIEKTNKKVICDWRECVCGKWIDMCVSIEVGGLPSVWFYIFELVLCCLVTLTRSVYVSLCSSRVCFSAVFIANGI